MNSIEHLVLQYGQFGFRWKFTTKYHADLGDDLQAALDVLEREGWQVVTSFYAPTQGARVILTRVAR